MSLVMPSGNQVYEADKYRDCCNNRTHLHDGGVVERPVEGQIGKRYSDDGISYQPLPFSLERCLQIARIRPGEGDNEQTRCTYDIAPDGNFSTFDARKDGKELARRMARHDDKYHQICKGG